VLSFPVAVNPVTQVEKNRVHLFFRREPVVGSGADNVPYNDPFLAATSFAEIPGGAEFIANVQQAATVVLGDAGHTITIAPVPPPAPATQSATQSAAQSQSAATNPAAPQRPAHPFVVLDAAHGGTETGAVLSPTLLEKNVNLAFAHRLQKELQARGISVILTRNADFSLTWDQRAVLSNVSHASLYVALHASASGHGLRVYTSLLVPAQSAQQRTFLPWETAQASYLGPSSAAAAALAAQCTADGLPVRNSAAPLRPLNSITMAAVAVELAPLGASPDELATLEYQQKAAESLATAIAALRAKLEAGQ
jgi:N-acetylmuramoyl-L-alanine amidase